MTWIIDSSSSLPRLRVRHDSPSATGSGQPKTDAANRDSHGGCAMDFDGGTFLMNLSDAYNARDREKLGSLFALEDPRFCIFEEFSGELLYAEDYRKILSLAEEGTGMMSFEALDSRMYGDFALVHAIQKVYDGSAEPGKEESHVRATFFISLREGKPRILSGHFSSMMLCFPKRETAIRWHKLGQAGR